MARVNFDDNVETQDEFWRLLPLVGNDRDKAIGMLIRFFRKAQKAYARGVPMLEQELVEANLVPMLESGWAQPVAGGWMCKGAEKHFDWYINSQKSAKAGGNARVKNAQRDKRGRLLSSRRPAGVQPEPAASSALALAPSLAPVIKTKNIYTSEISKSEIQDCFQAWQKTLDRYGIKKKANLDETTIFRLIQTFGIEKTKLALLGAGLETKTDKYNPAKHCRITRLLKPDIFEMLCNLGAQVESNERIVHEVLAHA